MRLRTVALSRRSASEGRGAAPGCGHTGRDEGPLRALVISGSVGAGHDGAAAELARRLRARGMEATCRDFLDALPRPYQRVLRDGYAFSASHAPAVFDWLFRCGERDSGVRRLTMHVCRSARRDVADWAHRAAPEAGPGGRGYDVVVTTFPFAAQTLGMLKRDGALIAPTVCYLTDPAPHRLWVHPHNDAHLTCTEATAVEGMERYGVPMAPAGPLAHDAFRQAADESAREGVRQAVRAELGVAADQRIALMMTGSLGLGDVMGSVRAMRAARRTVPVVLCGRNDRLRRRIEALPGVVALGWRDDVPRLMAAADVLVHNAGGLSLTEALVAGLPAVSYEVLSGHGRANAATLAAAGIAPWPQTPAGLADALEAQAGRGRVYLPLLPPEREAAHVVEALARRGRDDGFGARPLARTA
ncbi:glycosyltransferase [Streptomyces sp. RB6PN25]|uniref:Glycosyltransferase n=1 Tax=Streptomyces humicola TaxID=2953240 RepID=A0ABT1PWJ6_9ACTN|nr:glycosyltransferase [Streptomyces humicola]MCQ4082049.1 glycosyltransferase [Streptomyces humicola]